MSWRFDHILKFRLHTTWKLDTMERLEIHSKSFLIKWVNACDNCIINWQVKPNKKSINVGLFRKVAEFNLAGDPEDDKRQHGSINTEDLEERLQQNGLQKVYWHGKCNAEDFVKDQYDVDDGQGGMYALVFDNTFSKTTSKTVLFSQQVSSKKKSPALADVPVESSTVVSDGRYITGILLKKRRKRLQGYGRRYFSLDYKYGLLNYFLDQKSSLLRGSMPIQLCVISAKEQSRDIFIDSGMEVWSLRALTPADFDTWVQALDLARHAQVSQQGDSNAATPIRNSMIANEGNDWAKVEKLFSRLEAATSKAQNVSSPILKQNEFSSSQTSLHDNGVPPLPPIPNEHKPEKTLQRKPSFWKRRASRKASSSSREQQPSSSSLGQSHTNVSTESVGNGHVSDWHDLVSQLTEIVSDFKTVLAERERAKKETISAARNSMALARTPRQSMDVESVWSDEMFYDAPERLDGGVVYVNVESSGGEEEVDDDDDDLSTLSDDENETRLRKDLSSHHSMPKHDLYPLPDINSPVKRRTTIAEQKGVPPSLVSILRKNVGKDLTTVAMPITMNEPISFLQRLAEFVEASNLIDKTVASSDPVERVMLIALFGITSLSGFRARERCARKSFNPLLGETYELVREDKGFRLVAEKISHRPVGFAMQAESKDWTLQYSGYPKQKFWGKSAEFTDTGPYRITLNETGEAFEFLQPAIFMRNIIAGEKYMEPTGHMTVYSSTGAKAVVQFKAGGMFSGRSEDLTINGYDSNGNQSEVEYQGTWTNEVGIFKGPHKGQVLWKASKMLPDYEKKYGFSEFMATLNEVTPIEEGHIPPTDSRLRPDQRMYEKGDIDNAEQKKLELEEKQRTARHEMEQKGEKWTPTFFELSSEGNDFYVLKNGSENYWERRKNHHWDKLPNIF
jgi:hypothetical protein